MKLKALEAYKLLVRIPKSRHRLFFDIPFLFLQPFLGGMLWGIYNPTSMIHEHSIIISIFFLTVVACYRGHFLTMVAKNADL